MTRLSHPARGPATALLVDLLRFHPRLSVAALLLLLARSISEGVTFVLLIPLLASVGLVSAGDSSGAEPGWLQGALDAIGLGASLEVVLGAFLAAIAARALLGYASAMACARLEAGFVDHIRQRVYRALSRASWLHLLSSRQSDGTQALSMQAESAGTAVYLVVSLTASLTTIAAGLTVAGLAAPWLTLTVGTAALAMALPMVVFQRRAFRRGTAAWQAMQVLYASLAARMDGLKLAKAFSLERPLEQEFSAASESYRAAAIAVREDAARALLLQEAAAAFVLTAFVYGALRVFDASSLEIVLLIAIFARLLPRATDAQSSVRALAAVLPELGGIRSLEDAALAAAEALPEPRTPIPLRVRLELRGASFRYPAQAAPALDNVTLELPAHRATGIVGLSGAGKSTLADLLAGLIAPGEGTLLVDGTVIDEATRPHWRAGVAYIPQDTPLFNDTIRRNLLLGLQGIPEDEVWTCLELARAAQIARALPRGLETITGERGLRLSGGERQRLRLASALLRRPELLILDEATSALNPVDEREIIGALRNLLSTTTVVMIAHRPSSLAWTDRLVVLERGRIIDMGPTERLLRQESLLHAMRQAETA